MKHTKIITNVRYVAVPTLLLRFRNLGSDDSSLGGVGNRVSDKEWVSADAFYFLVGQVWRVTAVRHSGNQAFVNILIK